MRDDTSRRCFVTGALSALAALSAPSLVSARPRDVEYAMRQDLGNFDAEEGRVHLDLPRHSDAGTTVPLTVSFDGEVSGDEYPLDIHVYGSQNPRPRILAVSFTPRCGKPSLSTRIRLDGAQVVTAIARTATAQHWRSSQKIGVTFGACADVGEGSGLDPDWTPRIRVSVPETAKAGEAVEIRTVISHPMETGLRLNKFNQYVPLRIIEKFRCLSNGETVLEATLEPSIATNPYLSFFLLAEETGEIRFEWHDTTGSVYVETAKLEVM